MTITRKGGKIVTIPRTPGRSTLLPANAATARSSTRADDRSRGAAPLPGGVITVQPRLVRTDARLRLGHQGR
jgi:hypothetical protein